MITKKGVSGESLENGRTARIAKTGYLDWPLPVKGYPRIRNATPKQLQQAVDYYRSQGWQVPECIEQRLAALAQKAGTDEV